MAEKLNVDRILDLLDVVHKTIQLPNLAAISREAMTELLETNAGLVEKQAEEKKKAEEEAAKAIAESKQKEKEYA